MSLFGFDDNDGKNVPTWAKPEIVCPTTGNTYKKGQILPKGMTVEMASVGFDSEVKFLPRFDDFLDMNAPAHAEQAKQVSDDVKEIKEMMKSLLDQNKNLQDRIAAIEAQLSKQ